MWMCILLFEEEEKMEQFWYDNFAN
jgi:hypothetical protein